MTTSDAWKTIERVKHDYYGEAARWKSRTGKKVVGCLPMGTPEEVLHAAGVLPLSLLGCDEPVTKTDEVFPPTLCPFMRTGFDDLLKGDLNFLDGAVVPEICDALRCGAEIWRIHSEVPVHHLMPPLRVEANGARTYMVQVLQMLKTFAEKVSGEVVTEDKLRRSIHIYNENRSLMRQLSQRRREDPLRWNAQQISAIGLAGMVLPKEQHNEILKALLAGNEPKAGDGERVRLFVYGALCDEPRWGMLDVIDHSDAIAVDDDLYVGGKYYLGALADETGDPFEALADRYLNDNPCPTKTNFKAPLADYLIDRAKEANASGFLFLIPKFCDPLQHDYTHLRQKFDSVGLPSLMLEYSEQESRLGQFETRLQAFVEMLKGA